MRSPTLPDRFPTLEHRLLHDDADKLSRVLTQTQDLLKTINRAFMDARSSTASDALGEAHDQISDTLAKIKSALNGEVS